jgi:hypothetical protein
MRAITIGIAALAVVAAALGTRYLLGATAHRPAPCWFNDVWMKEVFANFMAAKIVNPSFLDVDHDLRFLVQHYPGAYSVDRSAGANPIRQNLANLDDAGSLYGAIIYYGADRDAPARGHRRSRTAAHRPAPLPRPPSLR